MKPGITAFVAGSIAISAMLPTAAHADCETLETWFLYCVCGGAQPCPVQSSSLEKSSRQELQRKHDEAAAAITDLSNRNALADSIGGAGGRADPLPMPQYEHSAFVATLRNTSFFQSYPTLWSAADQLADKLDGSTAGAVHASSIEQQFAPLIPDPRLSGRQLSPTQRELAIDTRAMAVRASADQPSIEKDLSALRAAIFTSPDLRGDWRLNSRVKLLLAELLERRAALASIDAQLFSVEP